MTELAPEGASILSLRDPADSGWATSPIEDVDREIPQKFGFSNP